MFLYSVNGLHNAIRASETYQKLTTRTNKPMQANLLIDKCNVFVHTIILNNAWNIKKGDSIEPVRLSKQTLADQLGNGMYISAVKRILTELRAIHTDGYYNTKKLNPHKEAQAKSYIITKEWANKGIAKVGVLDQRTEKKYKNWKEKQYKHLLNKRTHIRILRNLSELYFNEEVAISAFNELTPFVDDPRTKDPNLRTLHYATNWDTLVRLNKVETYPALLDDTSFFYDKAKTNRIYHTYANTPSIYRESLRHQDGSTLIELDLKNSQPTMLFLDYIQKWTKRPTYIEEIIKKAKERDNKERYISGSFRPTYDNYLKEYPELLKDILNGDLYESVANYALCQGNEAYYDMYKSNRSEFKTEVLANGLFNVLLPIDKAHILERYLLEMYPQFITYLRAEKVLNDYKYISQLAQRLEASIFIDGIFDADLGTEFFGFAVPIHDSLIVKESEEDYWRALLYQKFIDAFELPEILESRLPLMIKTKKYNG
jgi:hypothetical protein